LPVLPHSVRERVDPGAARSAGPSEGTLPSAVEADTQTETGANERLGSSDDGDAADLEERAAAAPIVEADDAAQPTAVEPRPARLTVVVFPWGKVWINGKLRGPASLRRALSRRKRSIRLRPGQPKTLDFDLTK